MIKTYIGNMQLPVNPLDDVTFNQPGNTKSFDIVAIGEVIRIGRRKLLTTSIKSIFTDKDYPFVLVDDPLPAKTYVDTLKKMRESGKPQRFIMTGDGIDINLSCYLLDFKAAQNFGEWDEYFYTLQLKEYRPHSAKLISITKTGNPAAGGEKRAESSKNPANHTVVKGDCLWNIAKEYYGDASRWPEIYEANKGKIKDPHWIYPGQVFTIP